MKQVLFMIGFCLCGLWAEAQEGLQVAQLFDGRYAHRKDAVEVLVKGRKLKPYKLTLFRSLTLQADSAEQRFIEHLVEADAVRAADKESGRMGGRLYYGFFCIPAGKPPFRYIFFKNTAQVSPERPEITLVYMEGEATWEELKRMFE